MEKSWPYSHKWHRVALKTVTYSPFCGWGRVGQRSLFNVLVLQSFGLLVPPSQTAVALLPRGAETSPMDAPTAA